MIKQAVILAGGLGTRLRPLTDKTPKPMVLVNGRPFLEYIIELLKNNGISEIVICTGYLNEKITSYFKDGSRFGLRISYSIGDVSNETGKRLKDVEKLLDDEFLLLYCDNYWPLPLEKMIEFYKKAGTSAMMTLYTNKNGITKNNARVEDKRVVKYDKSRTAENLNSVDIGFFILNKSVINLVGDENCSFEEKVFPILVEKGQLAAYSTDQRYYSISTIEKMELLVEFLKPKKIVFLDRDGVINKKAGDTDYVKKWDEFEFIPKSKDAIKRLKDSGFKIIVVTNQSGIARGMMSQRDLDEIHANMQSELDGAIDGIYVCTHGWNDGCTCRKPNAGLLYKASDDFKIDLTKTFFVGDHERDLMAGNVAGCKPIFIGDNPENKTVFTCNDLSEAVEFILNLEETK